METSSQIQNPQKSTKLPTIAQKSLNKDTKNQIFDKDNFDKNLKKINDKLETNEKIDNEIDEIKNELIKAIVNTLMNNNDQDWSLLHNLLLSISNIQNYFENDRRINHYIDRIYFYTSRITQRDACKCVLQTLLSIFPRASESRDNRTQAKLTSLVLKSQSDITEIPSKSRISLVTKNPILEFYDGKLNPYDLKLKDMKLKPPDGLTISQIEKTIPRVTFEAFQLESNWKNKVSALALATSVDLREQNDTLSKSNDENDNQTLFNLKKNEDQIIEIKYNPLTCRQAPDFSMTTIKMTGKEMIVYLIKSKHLGDVKSYYLNIVNGREYRPYDLITVPFNQINREYYIFSVFGVLHVDPDGENENFSLDEWNRHAVLWQTCRRFRFFREFLTRKFLFRWKLFHRQARFNHLRETISRDMLIAIPDYCQALKPIYKLIDEVKKVKFLPNDSFKDNNKQILSLENFMDIVYNLNDESDYLLKSFFIYIKYIINELRESYYEQLRYFNELLNQDDIYDHKHSMAYQKHNRIETKKKYDNVCHEIGLLGNFVNLVCALLTSNLLELQRHETSLFIKTIQESSKLKNEAIFSAKLSFDKDDKLIMYPSKNRYLSTIVGAVVNVSRTIVHSSKILDFKGVMRDIEKYGFKVEKPARTRPPSNTDEASEEEKITNLERKLMEKNDQKSLIKKPIFNIRKNLDRSLIREKLVVPLIEKELVVRQYMVRAQSNELASISLEQTLVEDIILKENIDVINRLVDEAINDVEAYCQENASLSEIKRYITNWSIKQASEWKNKGSYEIEEQLTKIRNWVETVKSTDKMILTSNKVFKIDCSSIENILVPKLESIFNDICEYIIKDNIKDSNEFIAQLTKIIRDLDKKPGTVEEFADYAKVAYRHKDNTDSFKDRNALIKSLFEITRSYYRALNTQEENLDAQTQEIYKSFIFKLQKSIEFINSQAPNILEQLDELYKNYKHELEDIYEKGTQGIYTDPTQDSTEILAQLKNFCYEFEATEKILRQCATWKQSITKRTEDLSFIDTMSKKLNIRKDLWKFYQVTFYHIKDWKKTEIKKLNVKKVEEKLVFWENEALKIQKLISEDDRVWMTWWRILQAFKFNMKWISKLATDYFTTAYFNELFSAIGLNYDEAKTYTLEELIDLNLDEHAELIARIYKRAMNEIQLIQQFNQIDNFWSTKLEFNLAKHFPISVYKTENFQLSSASVLSSKNSSRLRMSRLKELRVISQQQKQEQQFLMHDVSYKLVDINDIRYHVEDSLIQLNMLLQSPIISLIKNEVESLMDKLNQLLLISELWWNTQNKWLYLERILNNNKKILPNDMNIFTEVVQELKSFQNKIINDPLAINVLKHENIRMRFKDWSIRLDPLLNLVANDLEKTRFEFPRFYFLDNEKLIETLSYVRDCRKYISAVRLCFPGVYDLVFQLPTHMIKNKDNSEKSSQQTNNQLEFDIYASELEVSAVIGYNGLENFQLALPLRSYSLQNCSEWFENFMKLSKSSLCKLTTDYLTLVCNYGDFQSLPTIIKRSKNLLSFPIQSVCLVEALVWSKFTQHIIESKQLSNLKYALSYLQRSINDCTSMQLINTCEARLRHLYLKLTLLYLHQLEITKYLMEIQNLSKYSYEWLSVLKYDCDMRKVLIRKSDDSYAHEFIDKFDNFRLIQVNNSLNYDFEYLNSSSQLAITPLTEKHFLSLINSINSIKVGALVGPQSCGKRSTINLLSELCGQHLLTINCCEALSTSSLQNYIKGLASSGSWILFDKIDNLSPNLWSSIAHEIQSINTLIQTLIDNNESKKERPRSASRLNTKQISSKMPQTFSIVGQQYYLNCPFVDIQLSSVRRNPPKSRLKFRGNLTPINDDEAKRVRRQIEKDKTKYEEYYKRKYYGLIRYQNNVVKISQNYGCFFTMNAYQNIPENIRNNIRVNCIIEPDIVRITSCLLAINGLNQASTNTDILARKLIYFLQRLEIIFSQNKFFKSCCNLSIIRNIIRLTTIKYQMDKGRPIRTLVVILGFVFMPNFITQQEKSQFNELLKEIFEFELSSIIEQYFTGLLKEQLEIDKLCVNQKQLQNMIDLYTGLQCNRTIILSGSPLSGKTTIIKTLISVINNLMRTNHDEEVFGEENKDTKSEEILKRFSLLNILLNNENKYPKIKLFHLFPNVIKNLNTPQTNEQKYSLLMSLMRDCENNIKSIHELQKAKIETNKPIVQHTEKWVVLDSDLHDQLIFDQLNLLRTELTANNSNKFSHNSIKFIYETIDINNLSPSLLSQALVINQEQIDWKTVFDSKINILSLKFMLPQSRCTYIQELVKNLFTATEAHLRQSNYKSILHSRKNISELNMINFVLSFINLIECLLKRHSDDLKQDSKENSETKDSTNWNLLNCICSYAYFWSFTSFISSNTDLNKFNSYALELLLKNNCRILYNENLKLYDCEINLKTSNLIQIKRAKNNSQNRDQLLSEYTVYSSLIQLCVKQSKPVLVYGDIGCGKTTLIEKTINNKFNYVRLFNIDPLNSLYNTLTKHSNILRPKVPGNRTSRQQPKYIYFIDDINVNDSLSNDDSSQVVDLMRQIMETNSMYSLDDGYNILLSDFNFILTCTTPEVQSGNYIMLNERLTRHFTCIYVNSNKPTIIESIYHPTIKNWLEEFPLESIPYPIEMAEAVIKSLVEVYYGVKEKLRPSPSKPLYLFNMKDVAKIVQGLQLVASRSKLKPKHKNKKIKGSDGNHLIQPVNIAKLFAHEMYRVFMDRMNDENDELFLKNIIYKSINDKFCTPRDDIESNSVMPTPISETPKEEVRPAKKAVTFKTGLLNERYVTEAFRGILVDIEQFSFDEYKTSLKSTLRSEKKIAAPQNEELMSKILYSKYIIRHQDKSANQIKKSTYFESLSNDLILAANQSVIQYEKTTHVKKSFYFHDDAIKHLCRLTRVLSMNRSNCLLFSEHYGLGRTYIVRFAAFLSKMKYYEPRISNDPKKNEAYLKTCLRQCCLMSGLRGSHSVLYIKHEYYSSDLIQKLCGFARTGQYHDLYTEEELCEIANQVTPTIPANKRTERTLHASNTFFKSIQDRLHIILSIKSGLGTNSMFKTFKQVSSLTNEFYIDIFKMIKQENIQSIARTFLTNKLNETGQKDEDDFEKLIKCIDNRQRFDKYTFTEEYSLDFKEIDTYSLMLSNIHLITYNYYYKLYLNGQVKAKPITFYAFKQTVDYFCAYMKTIYFTEKERIKKYEIAFEKLEYVSNEIENYVREIRDLQEKRVRLDLDEKNWLMKIEKQKEIYKIAVDECRKEEQLVNEMGVALEKLKADANQEFQDIKSAKNPQYESAVKAVQSLDLNAVHELRTYRQPPQRVLAVLNTLCIMFDIEPTWENGKQLLNREKFFDELVYYDKTNIPDHIFNKLEKIIALDSFKPEEVKPGSIAAGSLCEWIIAVYDYCIIARSIQAKNKELKEYEELYKKRQTKLGEKRLITERERETLEKYCKDRVNVLKEMNRTQKKIEQFNTLKKTANHLLELLDKDAKDWKIKLNESRVLISTFKTDALLTACFVCYSTMFDYDHRETVVNLWLRYFKKMEQKPTKIKFFTVESEKSKSGEFSKESSKPQLLPSKYSLRQNFNLFEIITKSDLHRDTILSLSQLSNNDAYFINNSIILREFCIYPTESWPVCFDPENYSLKIMLLLQNSIQSVRANLVQEELDKLAKQELKRRESEISIESSEINKSRRVSQASISSFTRSTSRISRSSIWETSTFYSRAQTGTSGFARSRVSFFANFANKNLLDEQNEMANFIPGLIESELTLFPKDNLLIINSLDTNLEYKMANAISHGLVVYLRNSEQVQHTKFIEKIINFEFQEDSFGRRIIKDGESEIRVHPGFKLILHVGIPMCSFNSKSNYNYLCNRLTYQSNSSSCIIDFTPSYNFISSDLLNLIMDYEKIGYSNQLNIAIKMLSEAKYNISNRHDQIINRLVTAKQNILSEGNMIDYMQKNNENLKSYLDSQDESFYTMKFLIEKRNDYLNMSKNVAALLDALRYLLAIESVYFVKWSTLRYLLVDELTEIMKERGHAGQSRANEIEKFCINTLYRYFSSSLKQNHSFLLSFFHSFFNSVKRSWLTKSNDEFIYEKLFKKDFHKGNIDQKINVNNLNKFKIFDSLYFKRELPTLEDVNTRIPNFLTWDSWVNLNKLETNLSKPFIGLCSTLSIKSIEWSEYLSDENIDLINDTPFVQPQMSIFNKLLLWLNSKPEKLISSIEKFNIYNFAGIFPIRDHDFDLEFMYNITSPLVSSLILVDSQEPVYFDVLKEIENLRAKKCPKVKTYIFTLSSQLDFDIFHKVLYESIQHGYWIIVENAHLIQQWPAKILHLLNELKDKRNISLTNDCSEYCIDVNEEKQEIKLISGSVNSNHRLWLVVDFKNRQDLPDMILCDAVKITPHIPSFQKTQKICQSLASGPLCNLANNIHSFMNQTKFNGNYTPQLEQFLHSINSINSLKNEYGISDEDFLILLNNLINDIVYGCKVENKIDAEIIKNLINNSFKQNSTENFEIKRFNRNSNEIVDDLQKILFIFKELYVDDEPNLNIQDVKFTFEINPKLVETIENLLDKLKECVMELEKKELEAKSQNDNLIIFEIQSYIILFNGIKDKIHKIKQSINGNELINNQDLEFIEFIQKYRSDSMKNSIELIDELIKHSKLVASFVGTQIRFIDLNLLINPLRFLNNFVKFKYLNDNSDEKFNKLNEKGLVNFEIEVIDKEGDAQKDANQNDLFIMNLNVRNANFNSVSQSFGDIIINEDTSVIKYCKLKPVIENDENKSKNIQYLPLIDLNNNKELCKILAVVERNNEKSYNLPIYFYVNSSSTFLTDHL